MTTQRDFVQIADNQTVSVTLKFATGLQREGQFGTYYMYTVIYEGKEKLLKVTERLEKQFRNNNLQAGQTIQLRRDVVTPESGESYSVINLVREALFEEEPTTTELLPKRANEMQLLQDSLLDARTICTNNDEAASTVAVAVGLFLARTMQQLAVQPKRRQFLRRPKSNAKDKEAVELSKKDDDLPF